MANNYRRFLKLLENWPVDPTKTERDIGFHLRERVKKAFTAGELFQGDQEKCARDHASLKRLSDDVYAKLYKRSVSSSASGLTAEQCNSVLSNEFLDLLEKDSRSIFSKIFQRKRYSQVCGMLRDEAPHIPVMKDEIVECFQPKENQMFIDMTFGAGGHTERLLNSAPNVKVYALDRDPVAFQLAKDLSHVYPGQLVPLLGKFSELPALLKDHGIQPSSIDGILFDLGCSSMQFDTAERGFSISKDGPLDMRMDGNRFPSSPTAADVLAQIDEIDLARILKVYGEEKQAKKIARAVVESRYQFVKLKTTGDLSEFVSSVCNNEHRLDKLQRPSHAATKTFQALRIFVNNEINELNYSLILAHRYLRIGGKIATLSFHSLEDRIVKRHLCGNVISNAINPLPLKYTDHSLWYNRDDVDSLLHSNWKLLHKHVLIPSSAEVEMNPRSRSAKLRCGIKIK